MTKGESHSYFKREELRGLFVLGLLAVFASIRVQGIEFKITVGNQVYNVVLFIDIMLIMWSFYAFFMVLGFSEDIIGERTSSVFREVSTTYLYMSFILLAFLSLVFVYSVYPTRTPWALGFLIMVLVYGLVRRLARVRKPFKPNFQDLRKRIKAGLHQILLSVFVFCLLLVMFGTCEEIVIPSFIIGSVCLIGFLVARERVKKT